MTMPADWYPDEQVPGGLRYWDGWRWTEFRMMAPGNALPQRPVPQTRPTREDAGGFSLFGGKKQLQTENEELQQQVVDLQREVARLRAEVERLGGMDARALEDEKRSITGQIEQLRVQQASLSQQVQQAGGQIVAMQDQAGLQDVGLYQYHHPAESSLQLSSALNAVRAHIKQCVRDKRAISAAPNFTFNNSAAWGRKFVSDMSRIMLRAYNAEAENCVKTVKAGNLSVAQSRLRKAMDSIAQQGQMIELRITEEYHSLRLKELELAADYNMMVQQEKEMERERKAELREQRKAEQELKAERQRLQKELDHYTNAIRMLEDKGDSEAAARLQDKLADVQHAIASVDYREANIRAGFVYVISNLGAFGQNMVKIGLTRRLEPSDRIRELGDASVPFRFDVHTLFFSDDAVTVETKLHQAFADKRVNKINLRREFFYATPEDVLEVLKATVGEVVEYRAEPEAEEFRLSQGEIDAVL